MSLSLLCSSQKKILSAPLILSRKTHKLCRRFTLRKRSAIPLMRWDKLLNHQSSSWMLLLHGWSGLTETWIKLRWAQRMVGRSGLLTATRRAPSLSWGIYHSLWKTATKLNEKKLSINSGLHSQNPRFCGKNKGDLWTLRVRKVWRAAERRRRGIHVHIAAGSRDHKGRQTWLDSGAVLIKWGYSGLFFFWLFWHRIDI